MRFHPLTSTSRSPKSCAKLKQNTALYSTGGRLVAWFALHRIPGWDYLQVAFLKKEKRKKEGEEDQVALTNGMSSCQTYFFSITGLFKYLINNCTVLCSEFFFLSFGVVFIQYAQCDYFLYV